MAKLSARGRTTIAEASREYSADDCQRAHDRFERRYKPDYADGSDPSPTTWERVTRRLRSDGSILEKRDVIFRPGPYDPRDGRRYSYSWKLTGKLKAGLTPDDFTQIYSAPRKDGSPSAWTVTSGRYVPPAKIISQARLMRAVRSGESIGFCTSCGSEQEGVEPDATGYQCEACGQMAVSGAEELLMQSA